MYLTSAIHFLYYTPKIILLEVDLLGQQKNHLQYANTEKIEIAKDIISKASADLDFLFTSTFS